MAYDIRDLDCPHCGERLELSLNVSQLIDGKLYPKEYNVECPNGCDAHDPYYEAGEML